MQINIVSLFPQWYESPLEMGLLAKARQNGLVDFKLHNPRDFATDKHKTVDDRPYGGGAGMVMMLKPLAKCLDSIEKKGKILLMSASGKRFTQQRAKELSQEKDITIICGRYEGIDDRLHQLYDIEDVCIGDFVLNGGEVASMVVIEAITRLIPNFMHKQESGEDESFSHHLLEYPHYTRPENYEGLCVPEVLTNGDHKKIDAWRKEKSLERTWQNRKDLLERARLNEKDLQCLAELKTGDLGRNLHIALVHSPVILPSDDKKRKKVGTSSITNLDIHDIARAACTYGVNSYFLISPIVDQKRLVDSVVNHWTKGKAGTINPDRNQALRIVKTADSIKDAIAEIEQNCGQKPYVIATSAKKVDGINANELLSLLTTKPILLLFGTAHGLADEALQECDALMRPLRFMNKYNHLSVRSAVSIILDRIFSDFN